MDRDTAIALIKSRCKRASMTALDADIIKELQYVQSNLLEGAPELPWFLLSGNLTFVTADGTEGYALPATATRTFLREYEEGSVWLQKSGETTWSELTKDDYEALYNRDGDTKETPTDYSVVGTQILLKPTPDAVYTIKMRVYETDQVLSTNIENNWLKYASDLIIAETCVKIARFYIRDEPAALGFEKEASIARNRLFIFDEARKHANRSYQFGDD